MWTNKQIVDAVAKSKSYTETLRHLGAKYSGSRMRKIKYEVSRLDLDTSHFTRKKYSDKDLVEAVRQSKSYAETIRKLKSSVTGSNIKHFQSRIKKAGISTDHFENNICKKGKPPWNKGLSSHNRKTTEEILKIRTDGYREKTYLLRRAMLESGINHICSFCSTSNVWRNKELVLEIDHIDGNRYDNRLNNLRFLCPNCHSQTKTYKNKRKV